MVTLGLPSLAARTRPDSGICNDPAVVPVAVAVQLNRGARQRGVKPPQLEVPGNWVNIRKGEQPFL